MLRRRGRVLACLRQNARQRGDRIPAGRLPHRSRPRRTAKRVCPITQGIATSLRPGRGQPAVRLQDSERADWVCESESVGAVLRTGGEVRARQAGTARPKARADSSNGQLSRIGVSRETGGPPQPRFGSGNQSAVTAHEVRPHVSDSAPIRGRLAGHEACHGASSSGCESRSAEWPLTCLQVRGHSFTVDPVGLEPTTHGL